MRFKLFLFFCFSLVINFQNYLFSQTLPTSKSGLKVWLDGGSGITKDINNKVSEWLDQSGNNNKVTQSSITKQPLQVLGIPELNNQAVVRLDGINDYLRGTTLDLSSSATLFVIASGSTMPSGPYYELFTYGTINTNNGLWLCRESKRFTSYSNNNIFSTGIQNLPDAGFTYKIFEYKKEVGIVAEVYENGVYKNSSSAGFAVNPFASNKTYMLGIDTVYNDGYWHGDIAEVIVYDRALAPAERQDIEQYLSDKYAPGVNLGPDVTVNYGFCPVKLNAHKDWYTSYTWNTGSTQDSIVSNSSGLKSVSVTNIFGYTSKDTVKITYPGNLSPYAGNALTLCAGSPVKWNTGLNKTGYSFVWQDGSTDSVLTINSAGQYYVTVTDTLGISGCTIKSNTITVTVDNFPNTASLGADVSICSGGVIELVSGAEQAIAYSWSTGETTSSIAIFQTGASTYILSAENVKGCVVKDTIRVNVKGVNPISGFIANSVCLGDSTLFKDITTVPKPDKIVAWNWSFGDGSTSSIQNPIHTYTSSGKYLTSLIVVSDSGCIAKAQQMDTVHVLPSAKINLTTSPLCTGSQMQFMDASSIASGTLAAWSWNFGDGTAVSNLKNPIHIYSSAGTFSVTSIVSSSFGCQSKDVFVVVVSLSPTAMFKSDSVCKGLNTIFTDQSLGAKQWLWDFGDGTSASTLANPVHKYSSSGTFSVSLLVTSPNGCVNTAKGKALIHNLPIPGFKGDSVCANNPIQFMDTSSVSGSSIVGWNWIFGSMGTSILQNPQVVFSTPGTYSTTLSVTSSFGCTSSTKKSVIVSPLPVPSFSFSPLYGPPPFNVTIDNHSTGAKKYFWNFGDGSKSNLPNPSHAYLDTGIYKINLIAVSKLGCVDSLSKNVFVVIPKLDIALTAVTGLEQSGLLKIYVSLYNNGTLDVSNIELSSYMDGGNSIHETWTGLLTPKSALTYLFNSSFELNGTNKIICVEIKQVNNISDDILDNNKSCSSITNEFSLVDPFPNPVENEIYFLFVSPSASQVKAEIIGFDGQVIDKLVDGISLEGLNSIDYNTSKLSNGVYLFRLTTTDKQLMKKFIKK